MKGFIVDSYALIAYFEDESGAEKVERILDQAEKNKLSVFMSMINWGEVYYSIYRSKGEKKAEEAIFIIKQLPIELIETDKDLVYQASKLKANYAIAFGDCFAASLAINMNYPILTGDKDFQKLGGKIRVEWV